MTDVIEQRLNQLNNILSNSLSSKNFYITTAIIFIVSFGLTYLILYMTSPKFIMSDVEGILEMNKMKISLWSLFISVLLTSSLSLCCVNNLIPMTNF